jgi:VanZ family protein
MNVPSPRTRWAITIAWLLFIAVIIYCADQGKLRAVFVFINAHTGSDKAGHFVLIGGMAFFLNLSLGLRELRVWKRGLLLGSVVVAVVFTLEEISQIWIPSRTFDLLDLAGDYSGIIFFGWLARRLWKQREQL